MENVWSKDRIHEAVETQRTFFRTGRTLDVGFRIRQLKKLKAAMLQYETELEEALFEDLPDCREWQSVGTAVGAAACRR